MNPKRNYLESELYDLMGKDSAMFDFLQEGSMDGIWYWDLEDVNQIWMSEKFWTTMGYDPKEKEHVVSEWQKVIHPEDLDIAQTNFEKHCIDPSWPYDQVVRYFHKNGELIWIRCRGIAVRNKQGIPVRMLGAHTNITELMRTKKQLEREIQNSNAYFNASPIALLIIDESFNIIKANASAIQFCGLEVSKIINHLPGEAIACIYQAQTKEGCGHSTECPFCPIRNGIADLQKNGRSFKGRQFQVKLLRNKVSTDFWLELGAEELNLEGKVYTCIALEDITDKKVMELDLMKSKQSLLEQNQLLNTQNVQMIQTISKIVEMRDAYTAGHQRRVQKIAVKIALEMGLSDELIQYIHLGALIHDVGKIYLPTEILNKPGKITDLEYRILQTHAELGKELMMAVNFPTQVKKIIYQHHERMDGTGYPLGISGDEILLESRIIAVADVVEAMSSDRPYRAALGIHAALAELKKYSGIRYDKTVVIACIEVFNENIFSEPNQIEWLND